MPCWWVCLWCSARAVSRKTPIYFIFYIPLITHHILSTFPGWRARRSSRCSPSVGSASRKEWLRGELWRSGRSWRRGRNVRCVYNILYHTLSKCQVCTNNLMDSVFLPCGHMMTCTCCGLKLVNCPICKQRIAKVTKIYRAWALQWKLYHTVQIYINVLQMVHRLGGPLQLHQSHRFNPRGLPKRTQVHLLCKECIGNFCDLYALVRCKYISIRNLIREWWSH